MRIDMALPSILLSIDLEDHTGRYAAHARYEANTGVLLDYLSARGLRATFFTVGRVAEHTPALVRRIADAGHEIACHSWSHTPLNRQSEAAFRRDTQRAKAVLEQVSGQQVRGYRAPVFSLTAQTPWVPGILQELGFVYSSSVLPRRHPLHGFAGVPHIPFLWPGGLVELPMVLGRMAGMELPFLGGVYLRYLPGFLVQRLLGTLPPGAVPWTYIHPYDIDGDERDWHIAHTPLWACLLLWFNRRGTVARLDALRGQFCGASFTEAVQVLLAGGGLVALG
jgi:polysaccharide deacetylase family protein (PEP-CTERM system associated)